MSRGAARLPKEEPAQAADYERVHFAFVYYKRLRRVKRYVERNYTERISLREVAQVAGLERKYFSVYFRDKTGLRFKDWINDLRVTHAKSMMQVESHSITEIAYAVGYRDLRTFQRAFKRRTGVTPRDFRKSVRP